MEIFFLRISVNIFGFPCPLDFFIHCPTKKPNRLIFPDWYSASWFGDSASTASTIASSTPRSFFCLRERVSIHSSALPHSKTSFSITILEFVDESSSALTSSITRAISRVSPLISQSQIFALCASNIANRIVVI